MHNNKKKVNKIDSNSVNKKKEFPNNFFEYLIYVILSFPLLLFVALGLLGFGLEPFLMSSQIKLFSYLIFVLLYVSGFNLLKVVGAKIFGSYLQLSKIGLICGFAFAILTATPLVSFFSSLYVRNYSDQNFEEKFVITEKRFTIRNRQYVVESIANHTSYTFLMHSRFGNQNDLYSGVTVKLKGIENSWGRLVTSYEVIDSPPIKN